MKKQIVLFCCIISMLAVSLLGATPTVYVAGYETDNMTICAWVDGKKKTVPNVSGDVKSLSIVDGKVYILGSSNAKPCYWADGVKTELPLAEVPKEAYTSSGEAYYLTIIDGIFYVCGETEYNIPEGSGALIYTLWVNGNPRRVENRTMIDTTGVSYTVSNGKAYAAVSWIDTETNKRFVDTIINGKATKLSGNGSIASDITVSGKNVYVAGRHTSGGLNRACFWADGRQVELAGGKASRATSIFVATGKVYVSGYYYDTANRACYWVNGVKKDLEGGTISGAVDDSAKLPITVYNGKVYIAGYYYEGKTKKACYWVDGKKVDLPGGSKAVAIAVQ